MIKLYKKELHYGSYVGGQYKDLLTTVFKRIFRKEEDIRKDLESTKWVDQQPYYPYNKISLAPSDAYIYVLDHYIKDLVIAEHEDELELKTVSWTFVGYYKKPKRTEDVISKTSKWGPKSVVGFNVLEWEYFWEEKKEETLSTNVVLENNTSLNPIIIEG